MHQEWNAVSIIHLWLHVIYLQLELLSIQQLKPKNCWDTAEEKTFAGLWDLACLVLDDDHTVWIPGPITSLGWHGQEAAGPAFTSAAASTPLLGSGGSAPTPAFPVLRLCPQSTGQHRTFSPGSAPLQWIATSILILHAWTPRIEYSNITLVIFKSTLSQHSLDLQGCRASTDSILTPVRRRVIWLSASSQMLSDDGPCHLHTRKPLSPTWSTLPHQKETYNTEIHTAFLLQCFSKSVPWYLSKYFFSENGFFG